MIRIIAVHFENGSQHEHITKYKWLNTIDNKTGITNKPEMVDFVNKNPRTVFVEDNRGDVEVFVIDANPPYLRTKADNRLTDNLLYLPTF